MPLHLRREYLMTRLALRMPVAQNEAMDAMVGEIMNPESGWDFATRVGEHI